MFVTNDELFEPSPLLLAEADEFPELFRLCVCFCEAEPPAPPVAVLVTTGETETVEFPEFDTAPPVATDFPPVADEVPPVADELDCEAPPVALLLDDAPAWLFALLLLELLLFD